MASKLYKQSSSAASCSSRSGADFYLRLTKVGRTLNIRSLWWRCCYIIVGVWILNFESGDWEMDSGSDKDNAATQRHVLVTSLLIILSRLASSSVQHMKSNSYQICFITKFYCKTSQLLMLRLWKLSRCFKIHQPCKNKFQMKPILLSYSRFNWFRAKLCSGLQLKTLKLIHYVTMLCFYNNSTVSVVKILLGKQTFVAS